jgi:hypothetical protein
MGIVGVGANGFLRLTCRGGLGILQCGLGAGLHLFVASGRSASCACRLGRSASADDCFLRRPREWERWIGEAAVELAPPAAEGEAKPDGADPGAGGGEARRWGPQRLM